MKKIAIIGSGGLGREVLGIIKSINEVREEWNIIGFYDDNQVQKQINNYPVIDKVEALNLFAEEISVVIAIGNPVIKEVVKNKINNKHINFPTLIHPSVIFYDKESVKIGRGVVIAANSVLTVDIFVDDFTYINTMTVLSHDVKVGKFTTIMPTVSISAGAEIGKNVYIGNGVKIDKPITVKNNCIIKAGKVLP